MELSNKKFLLIGGAGFIGSHTAELLIKEDIKELLIYDNFTRGKIENLKNVIDDKRVKIFDLAGDICQPDLLDKSMEGIDGVFHYAALWLLHCQDYPASAFKTNIEGTFNVINSCIKHNVKKFVFSSSASVYGDAVFEPMTEEHPLNNKNFYGATKICGEAIINAYHHRYNMPYVGLRYMNVYGPRQDTKGAYVAVILKILQNIKNNTEPTIYGDGSQSYDFISVRDCAKANICAMKSNQNNGFYNVATGKKTSLLDLTKKILDLKKSNLQINFDKQKNSFVNNRVGSIEKAAKDLSFNYEVDLESGLKDLIQWYDSNN
ncbi:NAD-dependent epimerase/dehydratase family protein [Candidatus Pelagibacter sp. Uisw_094]|uniref:NAD-dependent epimerase/dehydratase family protein n=1 Tax=Candidatus Pelagibacter sp. Uisw_094 TaxID=3230980 RepID=UPI0039EA8381|tara:strand:- start:1350 stop:2306 length:957 start_codon:yes stop_codon:yes gene_type:complete